MKKVKKLLSAYTSTIKMGESDPIDIEKIKSELSNISKSNRVYFNICVGMYLILFFISVTIILTNLPNIKLLTGLIGVLGISVAGIIKQMISLWREKSHVDLLYILTGTLKADVIKSVFQILAKRL